MEAIGDEETVAQVAGRSLPGGKQKCAQRSVYETQRSLVRQQLRVKW